MRGPVWPGGWREFTVRLFAADGSTVEQSFLVERDDDGRLVLVYAALDPFDDVLTTENGGALAEPYEFLEGEVTFEAAPPWDWYVGGWGFSPTMTTLQFDDPDQSAGSISSSRWLPTPCRSRMAVGKVRLPPTPRRWSGASGPIPISRRPLRWRRASEGSTRFGWT